MVGVLNVLCLSHKCWVLDPCVSLQITFRHGTFGEETYILLQAKKAVAHKWHTLYWREGQILTARVKTKCQEALF